MKRKVDSAGILIKHKNKFLLAHPSGSPKMKSWGIPKGRVDDGESIIDAAVRETQEECGLVIDPCDIKFLCIIDYNSKDEFGPVRKYLHVFLYEASDEILDYEFHCESLFVPHYDSNIMIPEVDNFGWFDVGEAKKISTKSFRNVFDLFYLDDQN